MSIADEVSRRQGALRSAAQDFVLLINSLDGKYENKENEIKVLEGRIEKLKEEIQQRTDQAHKILQEAGEQGALERKEAAALLNDAKTVRYQAKVDQDRAVAMTAEAQMQMKTALQRQKEADVQYQLLEAKRKMILEATK